MAFIRTDKLNLAAVPNPPIGQFIIAYDLDNILKQKDSAGVITPIGGSSSGSLPIENYVYLVEEPSDAVLMGDIAGNVYTNAQDAYDYAYSLAVANYPEKVAIRVGKTTAAGVGGILTEANVNFARNISIEGISRELSQIGNIEYRGSNSEFHFSNITLGSFTPNAGAFGLYFSNCSDATIGTVTMTSGGVFAVLNSPNLIFGNMSLSGLWYFPITVMSLNSPGLKLGDITGVDVGFDISGPTNGVHGGSTDFPTSFNSVNITNTRHYSVLLRGVTVRTTFSFVESYVSFVTPSIVIENCRFIGAATINRSGNAIAPKILFTHFESTLTMTGSNSLTSTFRSCHFYKIAGVPANSTFMNCTFFDSAVATPLISNIGAGCEFYNTSMVGGSLSIDNSVPVNVKFTSGYSVGKAAMGANVTLI